MPYCDQIDAAPVREHVGRLLAGGMTVTQIQNLSGVNRTAIRVLLGDFPGRKPSVQVRALTASRLLRTRLDRGSSIDGLVPAAGTRRRLRALYAIGYTQRDIASRLGGGPTARVVQAARAEVVRAATAAAVERLYRELADTPGPSSRAREHARNRGWLPPIWWDDDIIDDPLAEPEGIREYRPTSVQRSVDGHRTRITEYELIDDVTLPRPVRVELMTSRGLSIEEIADRIGTLRRYVLRDMSEAGAA